MRPLFFKKGCSLSKSEYVHRNRPDGPVESMTISILTEMLEIGDCIIHTLNAHDLTLCIKHTRFPHSPW